MWPEGINLRLVAMQVLEMTGARKVHALKQLYRLVSLSVRYSTEACCSYWCLFHKQSAPF